MDHRERETSQRHIDATNGEEIHLKPDTALGRAKAGKHREAYPENLAGGFGLR